MAVQMLIRRATVSAPDLRSRKKEKLRLAIQDAALELFASRGFEATTIEHIVADADTSVSTFFRYFRNKADVLVDDDGSQLALLGRRIVARPSGESGIVAVCEALLETWVHDEADPERSIKMAAVVESSTLLLGLRHEVVQGWIDAVAHALAQRDADAPPLRKHRMAARVVIGVFCDGVQEWIDGGCRDDLRELLVRDFNGLMRLRDDLTAGWAA